MKRKKLSGQPNSETTCNQTVRYQELQSQVNSWYKREYDSCKTL